MEYDDSINYDGQLVYLKPRNSEWKPLSLEAFLLLMKPNEDGKTELTDDEENRLFQHKQYINDTLLKSLQMPNLSVFAGSGTSLAEVAGPSMSYLWRKSMWLDPYSANGEDKFGEIKEVAKAVMVKVKYSEELNPNIEHFLSQCDAYLIFNEDEHVENFLIEVKSIILEECSKFIDLPNSDISAYESILRKLARRRVRDPRLKVFTTNYDMCFETAASNLGMMVVDGFSYTRKRRFDGSYFNYDVVRRDLDSHEFIEGVIHLYKLHGSVSWERCEKDIVESVSPTPEKAVLIYPAKGKYQQAFIQPHLELLSRFLESLRKPNSCLLIAGFGFNDNHLSEPIVSAIKSNPSLKIIIADYKAATHINNPSPVTSPYWAELARLSAQGADIHFVNGAFSDFVSLIPHLRALTPAEQLVNAVKQAGN